MRVLVVGSMALDTVETPTGCVQEVLGGAATYAALAASLYAPTVPICVVGSDFPEQAFALFQSRDIDISGIQTKPGKTFRWHARYLDDFNTRETLLTQLNVFEHFRPTLTPEQASAEIVFLANIHPELQLAIIDQVVDPLIVASDTMDLWISTQRELLSKVIRRSHLLFINDQEAGLLCSARSIRGMAGELLSMGPRCVVIKRGEYGAFLCEGRDLYQIPAYPVEHTVDPTGAGDAFAGGLLGYVARVGTPDLQTLHRAGIVGSVLASFTVEDFSGTRLASVTQKEVAERYSALRQMCTFSGVEFWP